MKKPLIIGALGLLVAGCHTTGQFGETVEQVCARESRLHSLYLTFIAPSRPAEKVAKAVRFHTNVQNMCAAGATIAQILDEMKKSEAARSE